MSMYTITNSMQSMSAQEGNATRLNGNQSNRWVSARSISMTYDPDERIMDAHEPLIPDFSWKIVIT